MIHVIRVGLKAGPPSAWCSTAQSAIAALNGPHDYVRERSRRFQERRDLIVSMLNQAHGLDCARPEGAFYVFPSCAELIGLRTPDGHVIENDQDFTLYLLEHAGVGVVQGSAYGMPGHVRVSFATSEDNLTEAAERIQRACAALA